MVPGLPLAGAAARATSSALRVKVLPAPARTTSIALRTRVLADTYSYSYTHRSCRVPSRPSHSTSTRVLSTTARASSSGAKDDGSQRLFSPLVYAAGGLAVTVAGGIKYMHDHVGGTEGLARTMSFYSIAIPKYLEYRLHMFKESPDEVWDELDRETSKQGLEKILELRGFYIKSGQLAAANIGNAFPPIW